MSVEQIVHAQPVLRKLDEHYFKKVFSQYYDQFTHEFAEDFKHPVDKTAVANEAWKQTADFNQLIVKTQAAETEGAAKAAADQLKADLQADEANVEAEKNEKHKKHGINIGGALKHVASEVGHDVKKDAHAIGAVVNTIKDKDAGNDAPQLVAKPGSMMADVKAELDAGNVALDKDVTPLTNAALTGKDGDADAASKAGVQDITNTVTEIAATVAKAVGKEKEADALETIRMAEAGVVPAGENLATRLGEVIAKHTTADKKFVYLKTLLAIGVNESVSTNTSGQVVQDIPSTKTEQLNELFDSVVVTNDALGIGKAIWTLYKGITGLAGEKTVYTVLQKELPPPTTNTTDITAWVVAAVITYAQVAIWAAADPAVPAAEIAIRAPN